MPRPAKSPTKSASGSQSGEEPPGEVQGEKLEPIGSVVRELTRPDGTTVEVEVPVYPPFSLADARMPRRPPTRNRAAPSLKRKRPGRGPKDSAG